MIFQISLLSHPLFTSMLSVIFGGIIGSFANMLIYRLPHNRNILFPGSFCPKCNTRLLVKNLIPILSFLLQKGKCSACKKPIGSRYFIVELIYVGLTFFYLNPVSILFLNHQFFIFSCICIVLFFTDLTHFILPFYLNCSLSVLGVLMAFPLDDIISYLLPTLLFIAILSGLRLLFNYIYKKDTFGIGDIILLAGFSFNWGWVISLSSFYFASILGGLFCIFLLITKRKNRLDYIAFGPFLMLGFYISYFFKPLILDLLF
jgi:leader peptidase (prepilin peptidase) / N-methyltransferase